MPEMFRAQVEVYGGERPMWKEASGDILGRDCPGSPVTKMPCSQYREHDPQARELDPTHGI